MVFEVYCDILCDSDWGETMSSSCGYLASETFRQAENHSRSVAEHSFPSWRSQEGAGLENPEESDYGPAFHCAFCLFNLIICNVLKSWLNPRNKSSPLKQQRHINIKDTILQQDVFAFSEGVMSFADASLRLKAV